MRFVIFLFGQSPGIVLHSTICSFDANLIGENSSTFEIKLLICTWGQAFLFFPHEWPTVLSSNHEIFKHSHVFTPSALPWTRRHQDLALQYVEMMAGLGFLGWKLSGCQIRSRSLIKGPQIFQFDASSNGRLFSCAWLTARFLIRDKVG